MQLDKKNSKLVEEIINKFDMTFNSRIILLEKNIDFEHMGYFRLHYKYIPLEYDIIFETERGRFTIHIYDSEKASCHLYGIKKFNPIFTMENVSKAIELLEETLQVNNFDLYIFIDDKVYRKNKKGIKRIKNLDDMYKQ